MRSAKVPKEDSSPRMELPVTIIFDVEEYVEPDFSFKFPPARNSVFAPIFSAPPACTMILPFAVRSPRTFRLTFTDAP